MQRDIFNRCVQQNGHHNGTSNEVQKLELDALIVGGGFGGCYLLHRLREAGFNVKLVEAGTALGGIWHWSNYPGARVDSPYPVYQLSIPEVFKTFDWKEYYPSSKELQRYFRHLDSVLDISKDTFYETRVQAARWNDDTHKWTVECQNGLLVETRFMHCCLGFAAKRHFPDWAGLDVFQGYICHSSFWPAEGVDLKGKRVAVVGNGATGVQVAQETAKEAKELIVFIRTPNTALPMNQRPIDPVQAKKDLEDYVPRKLIKERCSTYGGFPYDDPTRSLLQDTPEERERVLDAAWARGGFEPLFTYNDLLTDREANRWVYDYWARKVRARITNPEKRDLMAPLEPLHPFMAKRASLEQDYYEQMDKDHVKLIDLKKNPVSHVVPEGIVTEDGQLHKVDIMAMATGFDSLTGGFTQIDFRGVNGQSLEKKWSTDQGALSYLGLAVNDFPVGLHCKVFSLGIVAKLPSRTCSIHTGPTPRQPTATVLQS